MHIPSSSSHSIKIEPFCSALRQFQSAQTDYDKSKWLYVPHYYSDYRYILGTAGERPLVCVGINPSTAAPDNLDNTLKSVERIAKSNGYDSFIMFNVYAQRATRPNDMDSDCNKILHEQNMKAFEYILSVNKTAKPSIWAAWGNIIEMRPYLIDCVRDMAKIAACYNAKWYTAGSISKKGHPHHPLYLKKDTPLDEFDIDEYLLKR